MMYPTDMVALAESRRDALEQEIRKLHLLAQLPQRPARWREWTGGGLMWAGSQLVNWGEGLAMRQNAHKFEIVR